MQLPVSGVKSQRLESAEGRTDGVESHYAYCYRVAEAAIEFAWIAQTKV